MASVDAPPAQQVPGSVLRDPFFIGRKAYGSGPQHTPGQPTRLRLIRRVVHIWRVGPSFLHSVPTPIQGSKGQNYVQFLPGLFSVFRQFPPPGYEPSTTSPDSHSVESG